MGTWRDICPELLCIHAYTMEWYVHNRTTPKIYYWCKKPETGGDCRPGNLQSYGIHHRRQWTRKIYGRGRRGRDPHGSWSKKALPVIEKRLKFRSTDRRRSSLRILLHYQNANVPGLSDWSLTRSLHQITCSGILISTKWGDMRIIIASVPDNTGSV